MLLRELVSQLYKVANEHGFDIEVECVSTVDCLEVWEITKVVDTHNYQRPDACPVRARLLIE